MPGPTLHQDAVVFDGLVVSRWSREVFEHMREGGLTAANCTICVPLTARGAMAFMDLSHDQRGHRDRRHQHDEAQA